MHRKLAQQLGDDVAVFATRKLATLIYWLLQWGQPCVDEGAAATKTATPSSASDAWRPRPNNLASN